MAGTKIEAWMLEAARALYNAGYETDIGEEQDISRAAAIIALRAPKDEWIPVSERMPTAEDADSGGDVLWYSDGSLDVIAWSEVATYSWVNSARYATHWRPLPAPPRTEPEDA